MRKLTALFGSCLFFFVVMTMYLLLDQFQVAVDKQRFLEEVFINSLCGQNIYNC